MVLAILGSIDTPDRGAYPIEYLAALKVQLALQIPDYISVLLHHIGIAQYLLARNGKAFLASIIRSLQDLATTEGPA